MSKARVTVSEDGIYISNIEAFEVDKISKLGWSFEASADRAIGENVLIPCHYARRKVLEGLIDINVGAKEDIVACLFDILMEGGEK